MIFGHISQYKQFALHPALQKGLNFLATTDFDNLELGVVEIEGRQIYAQILDVETKPKHDILPEVHQKYIDIQYLHRGNEYIGYAPDFGHYEIEKELLKERDIIFYKDNIKYESNLHMAPGCFAIFFPADIHRPACIDDKPTIIRKIVVKISMDLLL